MWVKKNNPANFMQIDIKKIIGIAAVAGQAINKIYLTGNFEVEIKSDNSPLTIADKASNDIIMKGLEEIYPAIPVISEEGKDIPFDKRKKWDTYFLVDPLDGTKEFIKRNGEFTVNIALIRDRFPVMGVIYAPEPDTIYYADEIDGAWKKAKDSNPVRIRVNRNFKDGLIAVQSRSHSGDSEKEFYSRFNIIDSISKGSSLKFCMIAEASADIYYRSGPTMEWDTAAGQAILEIAGGCVLFGTKRFIYNKKSLLNPGFTCYAANPYHS